LYNFPSKIIVKKTFNKNLKDLPRFPRIGGHKWVIISLVICVFVKGLQGCQTGSGVKEQSKENVMPLHNPVYLFRALITGIMHLGVCICDNMF
jgi:hypothetical protein